MINLFSNLRTNIRLIILPLKWLSIISVIILIPYKFWAIPSRSESLTTIITKIIPVKLLYLIPIILIIIIINWIRLIPYIFRPSPHGLFVFIIAFPLWISTEIFRTNKNISKRIAEILPSRTPIFLVPLIIPVEIVSLLIRPITLTLRLAINIIAGSLITTLTTIGSIVYLPLILPQIILHSLELGVSIIQAYVFVSLINLYKKS